MSSMTNTNRGLDARIAKNTVIDTLKTPEAEFVSDFVLNINRTDFSLK